MNGCRKPMEEKMGELKDKMRRDLELRGYRRSTLRIYLSEAERFAAYFMSSPREMGEEHIKRYLPFRKQSGGLSMLKISVAALKFLYIHTLDRPEEVVRIPWPRTPKRLPDILSGSEVSRLLEAIESLKHRMIIMTAYSTGARIAVPNYAADHISSGHARETFARSRAAVPLSA